MASPLIYLLNRFLYRILSFFKHWYIDGFLYIAEHVVSALEQLDKLFALRVTARYFFKPLYQDYSFIGYVFGFLFRSARLLIGGFIYSVGILIGLALYGIWAGIPIYIMYYGFIQK